MAKDQSNSYYAYTSRQVEVFMEGVYVNLPGFRERYRKARKKYEDKKREMNLGSPDDQARANKLGKKKK